MIRQSITHEGNVYEIQLEPSTTKTRCFNLILFKATLEEKEITTTVILPVEGYHPRHEPVFYKNGKKKMIEVPKMDDKGQEIPGETEKVQEMKTVFVKGTEMKESEVTEVKQYRVLKRVKKWELFCRPKRSFIRTFAQNYLLSTSVKSK